MFDILPTVKKRMIHENYSYLEKKITFKNCFVPTIGNETKSKEMKCLICQIDFIIETSLGLFF